MFKDSIIKHTHLLGSSAISFVEEWHYSKSAKSMKQTNVFELYNNDTLIGVAIFGQPCGRNVESTYGKGIVELRRFCLIDNTPKNAESWFLSKCIKYLKRHTFVTGIISYSDPNFGHLGIIYKASNFTYLGKEKSANPRAVKIKDKLIHIRELYQRDNTGNYNPKALRLQKLIKQRRAKVVKRLKKDIFFYKLQNKTKVLITISDKLI